MDPYQLCHPDPLHQTDLGDQQRLTDGLLSHLPPSVKGELNRRLQGLHHPGLPLPKGGYGAGMVPAYQQSAAFKCLPVALIGLNYEHASAYMIVAVSECHSFGNPTANLPLHLCQGHMSRNMIQHPFDCITKRYAFHCHI